MRGVGFDLLEIDRLERALERRPRLAGRLFTEGERDYCEAQSRPSQHYAARFCAKEAVTKALSLPAVRWHEIEVVNSDTTGAPSIRLLGALATSDEEILLSLSHTNTTAGAVAIAS
jgi:holo-[acyl-carrier protein] synthase